jgi:hypothetical protein
MLRRMITLALAGLAIAAPPALANSHWHWTSRMQDATAAASRSPGGCSIKPGSQQGSLLVACDHGKQATLTYAFPLGKGGIQGKPWCGVARWGFADVSHSWRVSGGTLRVNVKVTNGMVQLYTVGVGYYTH